MQKPSLLMRRHRSYFFRRLPQSPAFRILVLLYVLWDSLHCLSLYTYQTATITAPPPPRNTKRVYIASQHWNDARLLREHWNNALVALVQELGIENVYVSIYESGSYDGSKTVLRELDAALESLQVKRSIQLSDASHADEIAQQPTEHGWIKASDGKAYKRRIPFLATIRNHVFEPLERLTAEGQHFDTILFLNDVVFTPADLTCRSIRMLPDTRRQPSFRDQRRLSQSQCQSWLQRFLVRRPTLAGCHTVSLPYLPVDMVESFYETDYNPSVQRADCTYEAREMDCGNERMGTWRLLSCQRNAGPC